MDSATADTAIVPPLKTQDENPSGDTGDNCPVCLDAIGTRGMVRTACGHAFCFGCFEKFIVLSNSCPLCRTKVMDNNSVLEKRIREMPGGEQNMFGESAWEREWATATNQVRDAYRRVRETREANRVREADRVREAREADRVREAREAEDRVREARDAERAEERVRGERAVARRRRREVERSRGGSGATGLNPPDAHTHDTGFLEYDLRSSGGPTLLLSAEQSIAMNNSMAIGTVGPFRVVLPASPRVLVHVKHMVPRARVSIYMGFIVCVNRRTCKVQVDDSAYPDHARPTFTASILHGEIVPDTPIMRESFAAFWREADDVVWSRAGRQNVPLSSAVPAALQGL